MENYGYAGGYIMADISDVETGLVTLLASVIYPTGTGNPSAVGVPVKVYSGWPTSSQLDPDLIAGTAHVTVYPLPSERIDSMINLDAAAQSIAVAGTTLAVSGSMVTVGGVPVVGDVAAIIRNGVAYAYAVLVSDTTATIASALAALIGGSSVGSVVTSPALTYSLSGRVSTVGTMLSPMRRICRQVQITVWASTPTARDTIAKAIDAGLWNAERITLADGSSCGLVYVSSPMTDNLQKANLYRRNFIIQAQYVELQTSTAQTVIQTTLGTSTAATPVVNFNIN